MEKIFTGYFSGTNCIRPEEDHCEILRYCNACIIYGHWIAFL